MTKNLFSISGGLLASAAMAMTALAAPLKNADVAANPVYLFHVDFDALVSSSVGKAVLADPDVQTKLAGLQALFSFDLRSQLHGVTTYTTTAHTGDGVMMVYADFDPDRLVAMAKAFPGFKSEGSGSHTIYSWSDDKKKDAGGNSETINAAVAGHRVVFGRVKSQIADALDVLDGKSGNFAESKSLLAGEPGELVVAQGIVLKGDLIGGGGGGPGAAIFQSAKTVRLVVGEAGGDIKGTMTFEAKDTDSATQISQMIIGFQAMMRFQKANPGAAELASHINVKQDGSTLTLILTEPSNSLLQLIKSGALKEHHDHDDAQK